MTNREYTNAVGRRKETTATVKLYAKGAGNILVKTATGKEYTLADYFGGNIYLYKNAVLPFTTLGNDALKKFDAKQYGGAPILGLKGLVIKVHGNTDGKEVTTAIKQAKEFAEKKLTKKIAEAIDFKEVEE